MESVKQVWWGLGLRRGMLLVLLVGMGVAVWGQDTIRFGRYRVLLDANAQDALRKRGGLVSELGVDLDGYYYVVMQFSTILDSAVHAALQRAGVRLYDYLGACAYYARVPKSVKAKRLRRVPLVSIALVKGIWKTEAALVDDAVPAHAHQGWGVKAVLQAWEGFDESWVRRRLGALGVVYSDFHYESSLGRVRLVANRRDLLRLSEESWVKLVGLQGPPSDLLVPALGGEGEAGELLDRLEPAFR